MVSRKIKKKFEESRIKYGVLGIMFVIVLLLGSSALFVTFDVSKYGDPVLYKEGVDVPMIEGDVLNVQSGDTLIAWLVDDPDTQRKPTTLDWTVTLRLDDGSSYGQWVEDAYGQEVYPADSDNIRWYFNLESCLEGTFSYYVYWFAMIGNTELDVGGSSITFSVVNTEEPVYSDAVWVTEPDTELEFSVGQTPASIIWKIAYNGSFTANIKVDGTEVWTDDYGASSGDEIFVHTIDTSVVGTQSIILTITPDVADNPPLVSDTVLVTITGDDGNGDDGDDGDSTTTTTTPTTPTTDTDTDDDEPEPIEDLGLYIGFGAAMFIVAYVVMSRRKRK